MKTRLIGLNRIEVQRFLEEIEDEHRSVVSTLEAELADATRRIEELNELLSFLDHDLLQSEYKKELLAEIKIFMEARAQSILAEARAEYQATISAARSEAESLRRSALPQYEAKQNEVNGTITRVLQEVTRIVQTYLPRIALPDSGPLPAQEWVKRKEKLETFPEREPERRDTDRDSKRITLEAYSGREPTMMGGSAETACGLGGDENAVQGELSRILNDGVRYLLGHLVGKDLRDRSGGLIALRGERITEELVARAHQAGKLPELIIDMELPATEMTW